MILLVAAVTTALTGCAPGPASPDQEEATIDVVESVPEELLSWFRHEIGQDRGARVFHNSHGDSTFYVATPGRQSVAGGQIEVREMDSESETWSVRLEYLHPDLTKRSPEIHYLIFRVPRDQAVSVSLAAATGVSE